jgi:indolepyruvate ferredoxin oxidoreductase beta subunit
MDEKIAMGDGRLDRERLIEGVKANARDAVFIDMAALARQSGAIVSAVMLGALAASDRLPLSPEQLEAAIRADGKAVDANLRGFRAGYEAARANAIPAAAPDGKKRAPATLASLEQQVAREFAGPAHDIVLEGVRRLSAYQDLKYAHLYLARLHSTACAEIGSRADGKLLTEVARQLAVRMSFEDVGRVAEAKIAPARLKRIAREELSVIDEPFSVHDFLKPGIEELTQVLPPSLARPIRRFAERRGWMGRVYFGMQIQTTSVFGYLRFFLLAKLRRFRPRGIRYAEEQEQIESWLELIRQAVARSPELALEIAQCARLIKGYGDTYTRGLSNYRRIESRVIRPALAGDIPLERVVDAIASARVAALADPEGESLAKCLAEIDARAPMLQAAE